MATNNILDFGARGDGTSNDTAAIQQALDACATCGGGTVLVPAGFIFLTSTLELKSNTELHIERGAVLKGCGSWDEYPEDKGIDQLTGGLFVEDELPKRAMIAAFNADHVAITGSGVIDGNGRSFVGNDLGYIYEMTGERAYLERPFTIFLVGCKQIQMRDITVQDGAFWTVRLTGCEDVSLHAITIDNDVKLPNNDGIDIDACKNVRISDCHVQAGDDAICLKTCRAAAIYWACENITVTNCDLKSTSAALKLGNESYAPIRNVIFEACVIRSSHRGMAIQLGEQGNAENILFSNIVVETRLFHTAWWGRGEPIYVAAIPWHGQVGHIRNVRFSNILAHAENGAFILGWEPGLVDGIVLENVRLELDKWSKFPGGEYDLRPCPGEGLVRQPTAGFYIKNAANVTLRNCELVVKNCPTFGSAVELQNAENFNNQGFQQL